MFKIFFLFKFLFPSSPHYLQKNMLWFLKTKWVSWKAIKKNAVKSTENTSKLISKSCRDKHCTKTRCVPVTLRSELRTRSRIRRRLGVNLFKVNSKDNRPASMTCGSNWWKWRTGSLYFIYLSSLSRILTVYSKGKKRDHLCSAPPYPPAHEHWDIYLHLCIWDV